MMTAFDFVDTLSFIPPERSFACRLIDTVGKEALLSTIGAQMGFPEYFGRNWDALEECLNDLSWVKQDKVFLIHDRVPILEERDLRIYLKILLERMNQPESDLPRLYVLFPKEKKSEILSLVREPPIPRD